MIEDIFQMDKNLAIKTQFVFTFNDSVLVAYKQIR